MFLYALFFGGARLAIGNSDSRGEEYFDDIWDYQDRAAAKTAFETWDGQGEPAGWYRHPVSGRRRRGGDPAREFIRR